MFTAEDLEKIVLLRKLTADQDGLEISSSISLRRCNWSCIEKIGPTSDFVFIHVGGCPIVYVPRRDFPSQEAFEDFGQAITKLWKDYESRNTLAADS